MNERLGHPVLHVEVRMPRERRMRVAATRAVAQIGKGVTFPPALAASGGGHIHLPGVAQIEFSGLRFGSQPIEKQ